MRKRVVASVVFLSLVTTLLTFGLTGGVASARSIASTGRARAAAIGGCMEHYGGPNNWFEMGVCISDRNTGYIVYPDAYVNQQPLEPFNCSLYVELWDEGVKFSQAGPYSCTTGHYDGIPLVLGSGVGCFPLHTSVWISWYGIFYRIGDSPTFIYCN